MSIGKNTAIVPRSVRVEGDRNKLREGVASIQRGIARYPDFLNVGLQARYDAVKEDSHNVAYQRMVAREKEQDKTISELRLRIATLDEYLAHHGPGKCMFLHPIFTVPT